MIVDLCMDMWTNFIMHNKICDTHTSTCTRSKTRTHTRTINCLYVMAVIRGCAKKKTQQIRDYYGSGWVDPGLTRNNFCVENHPKIPLNQYRYFGVVYNMYSVCIYIVKSCSLL